MSRGTSRWRQEWKRFSSQEPGCRFRGRYEARHEKGATRSWLRKLLNLAAGTLLLAIGAFFAIAPGPAFVFFVLGGVLIANESRLAARILDWLDVLVAPPVRWVRLRWNGLSPGTRRVAAGCMLAGSLLAAVVGFVVFL